MHFIAQFHHQFKDQNFSISFIIKTDFNYNFNNLIINKHFLLQNHSIIDIICFNFINFFFFYI